MYKKGPPGEIRLACVYCDDSEFDGIDSFEEPIKKGWKEISWFQSYDSCELSPPAASVMDWQTHYGICPECFEEGK